MTIVVTGGGSGGHITPILAVASELKKLRPKVKIIYIGQRGDKLADIPAQHPAIDEVYSVRAGKFRRYHGEGFKQLLDIPTIAKNLRDAVYVLIGLVQSYWLLRKLKPAVIFTRGGFVSVPVALGGKLNRIPYLTHDSDSTPSLANRIIARWAMVHAVALPEELYPYPRQKTIMVGVPVSEHYQPVTAALQAQYRQELGLQGFEQVLLVTGGGNGAHQLNQAVIANAPYLLQRYPKLCLLHIAGRDHELAVSATYKAGLPAAVQGNVRVVGFTTELYKYSGAADIVIGRGGATNLAEFALQGKACLIVPSPQLIWNVKNTETLARQGLVLAMTEDQAEQERRLALALSELFDNPTRRQQLGASFAKLGRPDAAKRLAVLVLEQAKA